MEDLINAGNAHTPNGQHPVDKMSMAVFVESLSDKPIPPYQREVMEWLAKGGRVSEAAMRKSPNQVMLDKIMTEKRNEYVEKCMIAAQTGQAVRVWVDDCVGLDCRLEDIKP